MSGVWKIERVYIYERISAINRISTAGGTIPNKFAAGAELDAQVPAEDPPGEAAGLGHGEADRGPREGAAQDLHIPGGHIHRCHRLSESARKFHFVSRYRYTPAFPFCARSFPFSFFVFLSLGRVS